MTQPDLSAIQGIALGIEGSLRASGVPRVMIGAEEARQLLAAARLALKAEAFLREHGFRCCTAAALTANRSIKARALYNPVGLALDKLMKDFGIHD